MGQEKSERRHCDDRRVWGWKSKEARGKEKMMRECEVGGKCKDGMIRRGMWCGV